MCFLALLWIYHSISGKQSISQSRKNALIIKSLHLTTTPMQPFIQIAPAESFFTDALHEFKVTDLQPFQLYRLELSLEHKTKFRSVAFYVADEDGKIDTFTDPAIFGMYTGVDSMGLFTALYTHPTEKQTAKLILNPMPEKLEFTLSVHFMETPKPLASTTLIRRLIHPSIIREPLAHPQLEGTLYRPNSAKRNMPCIIDLYGVAMGTKEHRAALLAAHGYVVLALAIFGVGKLSTKHEDVSSEYLQSAVDFVVSLPFTANTCAVVGTSFGGTLAYHTVLKCAQVKCAISINGQRGHYMVSQMNENNAKLPWAPVLPHNLPNIKYYKGFISYAKMYGSCELEEEHLLRFQLLRPEQRLLFISGGQDRAIDGAEQGRMIQRILEKLGKASQYEHLYLPKCGHIIDPPYMPLNDYLYQSGRYMAMGGSPYPHGEGQHFAWKRLLKFLRDNIGEGVQLNESKI